MTFYGKDLDRILTDPTYYIVDVQNWSCIEFTTGLVCASLPHLKPVLKLQWPRVFGDSSARNDTPDPNLGRPQAYALGYMPATTREGSVAGASAVSAEPVGTEQRRVNESEECIMGGDIAGTFGVEVARKEASRSSSFVAI
jgi:hypothetical protein